MKQSLVKYIDAARNHFGYGAKIAGEFGLTGIEGFRLALPHESFSDTNYDNDIVADFVIDTNESTAVDTIVNRIMARVFDAAGLAR